MNRTIRGMAGLLVALGASACANDYSLQFEGPPTKINASPTVMFITSGDSPKELLLRLVNDINQSVPASFTVSNVPAGMTVAHDDNYRPDYVNSDGTLQQPGQLVQQRYYVSADIPTGGMFTFTVTSGSISQDITVRVLPINLGAALSATSPAIGDPVTITAPANLSFTATGNKTSTVTIPGGGEAVITDLSAKSITFIPIPGSSGVATVSNVTLDYAPTLAAVSLATSTSIDVPAVTEVPLVFSGTNPLTPVTVTATGFRFESGFSLTVGGVEAMVTDISGDGTQATLVLPAGTSGVPMASGIHLASLTSVSLSDIPGPTALTLPTTSWNGANPDGNAPVINVAAPGTEVVFYDSWLHGGSDIIGGGGPLQWYNLNVATPGTRTVTMDWSNDADIDVYSLDGPINNFVGGFGGGTSNHPESFSPNYTPAAQYWVVAVLYDGADPGVLALSIK